MLQNKIYYYNSIIDYGSALSRQNFKYVSIAYSSPLHLIFFDSALYKFLFYVINFSISKFYVANAIGNGKLSIIYRKKIIMYNSNSLKGLSLS